MEPEDEIHANGGVEDEEGSMSRSSRPIISSGEQLDVEAYASLYQGRTKIMRLLFIADHCEGHPAMRVEALRMAYDEIKKGENTQLFREVVQKIDGKLGPNYGMDSAWCDTVDRRAELKKEKLENELNAYRVCNSILLCVSPHIELYEYEFVCLWMCYKCRYCSLCVCVNREFFLGFKI